MNESLNLVYYDMKNFLNKYTNFLSKNVYIDYHTYSCFMKQYSYLFSEMKKIEILYQSDPIYQKIKQVKQKEKQILKHHNMKVIKQELEKDQQFLCHIFSPKLDNQQKNILLSNENTMVYFIREHYYSFIISKVKYFIQKNIFSDQKILIFTKEKEDYYSLKQSLNDAKINVKIYLLKEYQEKFLNEGEKRLTTQKKYAIFRNYLLETVFPHKKVFTKIYENFDSYIYLNRDYLEFETFRDYHAYLYKRKFLESKLSLKDFVQSEIIKRKKNFRTILNETLEMKAEIDIANFLYLNSIVYRYHQNTFFLENNLKIIYQKSSNFRREEGERVILLKDEKTNYLETLTYQLIKRRIAFSKKKDEDIYQTLKETTMDSYMFDFIHQLLIPLTEQKVKLDNTKLNNNQKNILKQILSDYQKYVVEKKYIDDEVLNQRIAKSISRKTYTIFLDIDDIILENHSLILLKKYPNHFLLKNQISLSIKYSKYLQEQKWLYCPDTYLSQRELAMITEQFLKENIKKINEMILKDEKEIKVFFYQSPSSVAKNKSLMQLLGKMIEKYRAVDYLIAVDKESDQKKLIQDQDFFKKDKQTIVYQNQEYCCENIFKTKKTYPIVILPYLMEDTMEAIFNPRKNTYERKMILSASLTVAQKEIWIICSQEREEEIKALLYSFHKVTYFLEV